MSKKPAQVFHFSLQGKREDKYNFLNENSIASVPWTELDYKEPYYFFVPKDFAEEDEYVKGFKVDELFVEIGSGVSTLRDKYCIHFNKIELQNLINDFVNKSENQLIQEYNIQDSRDWSLNKAINDLKKNHNKDLYHKILYRPFDFRLTFYTGQSKGFIGVPQKKIANNLINKNNIALLIPRVLKKDFTNLLITNVMGEYSCNGSNSAAETNIAPLYLYPDPPTPNKPLDKQ